MHSNSTRSDIIGSGTHNRNVRSDFSRREFLGWAGAVAAAGVGGSALLAACGGGSNGASPTTMSPLAVTPEVVSSDLYASPIPQRLAFTVLSSTTADPDAGKPTAGGATRHREVAG